jgi:hypothetical protein
VISLNDCCILKSNNRHGGERSCKLSPQVALAALDTNDLELAQECGNAVAKKFPGSQRVSKMAGMLLEAQGEWEEADRVSRLLFPAFIWCPFCSSALELIRSCLFGWNGTDQSC